MEIHPDVNFFFSISADRSLHYILMILNSTLLKSSLGFFRWFY